MKDEVAKNPLRGLHTPTVRQQPEYERLKQDPKAAQDLNAERAKLVNDFKRARANNVPSVGRNQEHAWNEPKISKPIKGKQSKYYNEELSSSFVEDEMNPIFEDDLNSILEDETFYKEEYMKTESPKSKVQKGKVIVEERESVKQKKSLPDQDDIQNEEDEFCYYIFYNGKIFTKSNSLPSIKLLIEELLLEDDTLKVNDLVLMKRLKISTGIIIE